MALSMALSPHYIDDHLKNTFALDKSLLCTSLGTSLALGTSLLCTSHYILWASLGIAIGMMMCAP